MNINYYMNLSFSIHPRLPRKEFAIRSISPLDDVSIIIIFYPGSSLPMGLGNNLGGIFRLGIVSFRIRIELDLYQSPLFSLQAFIHNIKLIIILITNNIRIIVAIRCAISMSPYSIHIGHK